MQHAFYRLYSVLLFSELHSQTTWCRYIHCFCCPCWLPRYSPITPTWTLDPISPSTTLTLDQISPSTILTLDPISPSIQRPPGHFRLTSARRTVVLGKKWKLDKIGETLKSTKRCFKNQRQAGRTSLHHCENFWTLCNTLGHKIKE